MPILPKMKDGYVIIPIVTFTIWYMSWYIMCLLSAQTVGTLVITMFENIPDILVVAAFVVGLTLFIALVASYSAFVKNRKEESLARKKAIEAGEDYAKIQFDISSRFSWIYAMFAILGAVIACVVVLVAADAYFVPKFFADYASSPTAVALGAAAASIILYFLLDFFIIRPAADGCFYAYVEEPLVKEVFQRAADAKKNGSEVKADDIGAAIGSAIADALSRMSK